MVTPKHTLLHDHDNQIARSFNLEIIIFCQILFIYFRKGLNCKFTRSVSL